MIDDQLIMRTFLAADGAVAAAVGTRIYAAMDTPPVGWQPADGSCITFKRRGDGTLDEDGMVIGASYQLKCYGGGGNEAAQVLAAEGLYRLVYARLQYGFSYDILGIQREAGSEPLLEAVTGWPFTLSFWRVQFRRTA